LWTGTAIESQQLGLNRHSFPSDAINTMGQVNLDQLLALIGASDGLIASSTGPLHMAAAADVMCLGLYGPNAPEWSERWHPLGPKAHWITAQRLSNEGALDIQVDKVVDAVQEAFKA
jgi:ADP-heptose:LPS heptosyltransferase